MQMIDFSAWCNGKKLWINPDNVTSCNVREGEKELAINDSKGKPAKVKVWYADIVLTNGLVLSKEVKDEVEGKQLLQDTLDFLIPHK